MSKWLYLTDLAPQATIINLDSGEIRQIMQAAVKDKAPAGLRRGLLEETGGGTFAETGEYVPMTEDLLADLEDAYKAPNSWNYDWPHLQIETEASAEHRDRVASRLHAMMEDHPYEFELTGLQRRYLMYFSDGNYKTQKKFVSLIPSPESPPYRRDGQLRRRYDFAWDSIMRDASVPYPRQKEQLYGGLRPCLYFGPAWVVRFRLDDHDVLFDRCRVYVDDEANFICSDWCQRHDYSTYDNGINLQTGIYTFDGWVVNSCVSNAMQRNGFTPKHVTVKREKVRDLMTLRHSLTVPAFDDTFTKAKAAVAKYSKAVPVQPPVEVGPITADVLAEAMVAAEAIWATKREGVPNTEAPAPSAPSIRRLGNWQLALVENVHDSSSDNWPRLMAFNADDFTTPEDEPYVNVCVLPEQDYRDEDALYEAMKSFLSTNGNEGFTKRSDSDTIWFCGTSYCAGDDELNNDWYLWSAAQHYYKHMADNSMSAIMDMLVGS